MLIAETKLFVELTWPAAGLVIAGALIVGQIGFAILRDINRGWLTAPKKRARHD